MPSSANSPLLVPSALESFDALAVELSDALNAVLDRSEIVCEVGHPALVMWNEWRWAPLERADQRLLKDAAELSSRWEQLGRLAVVAGDERRLKNFEKPNRTAERVLDRSASNTGAPAPSVAEVRAAVAGALRRQLDILADLPTAQGDAERLLVPDTVTFLRRPDIEAWKLDGEPWTIVAVPQVVRELDEKKLDPRLGEKAEKVINRFKEYGRRGDTFRGVKLAGALNFREIAIEADMEHTLPWLRADIGDDRLLASLLELRFAELGARVAVITEDRGLQNKARLARLPWLDLDVL